MFYFIIWGALVEKYMALKWEERQKAYDSLYDFTQENFTGIRVIKAFVKEMKELSAFKEYFDGLYGQGLQVANWHMNGAHEPFDSFYESAVEAAKQND